MNFFKNVITCSIISSLYHLVGLIKDFYLAQYLANVDFKDAFVQGWSLANTTRSLFSEATMSKLFVPILVNTRVQIKRILSISTGSTVLLTIIFLIAAKNPWFVKAFAPKALALSASDTFIQIYQTLFLTFPFLTLAAFFGVFTLLFDNLWQMPLGPLIFNSCACVGIFCAFKFGLSVKFLCYTLVMASMAKALGRFFSLVYSWKNVTNKQEPYGLSKALSKIGKTGPFYLGFIATSRWIYRIGLIWFGSFLPKGQIVILYFCHKLVDTIFPIFGAAIDNWILVRFSRTNVDQKSFIQIFKITLACIILTSLAMLLCSWLVVVKFFPSCQDLIFAWKLYIIAIGVGALTTATRALRAFFYSKLAYKTLLVSNLTEVVIDLCLSYFATFYLCPNGLYLIFCSLIALIFSLAISLILAFKMKQIVEK